MEAEVAAVLHWLVDQTRPARERVLAVVADDVKAFLDKHYTADVPPITMPTVPEPAAEPADPRDAEIAKLKAELAAGQATAGVSADAVPAGYTSVLPVEIPPEQREQWEEFVKRNAGGPAPAGTEPATAD
jgi:hypothetical protein